MGSWHKICPAGCFGAQMPVSHRWRHCNTFWGIGFTHCCSLIDIKTARFISTEDKLFSAGMLQYSWCSVSVFSCRCLEDHYYVDMISVNKRENILLTKVLREVCFLKNPSVASLQSERPRRAYATAGDIPIFIQTHVLVYRKLILLVLENINVEQL